MALKLSFAVLGIATAVMLTTAVSASAEAYKTADGTVVVTGLKPTQRYQIRTLSAQNKSGTRQDKTANHCGEVIVEKAATYKTLVVGSESFEPGSLAVKTHVKCKPPAAEAKMKPKGVVTATPPEPK